MHSGWAGDLTCTKFFTQTLDGKHENFKTVSVSSLQPVTSMTKGSKGCLSVFCSFCSKFVDTHTHKCIYNLQNTRLQIVRVVVARVAVTPVVLVVVVVVCGDSDSGDGDLMHPEHIQTIHLLVLLGSPSEVSMNTLLLNGALPDQSGGGFADAATSFLDVLSESGET